MVQAHTPAWHVVPPGQADPHPPQLLSSLCSLMQVPLQLPYPPSQAKVHVLLAHAAWALATLVAHW
jgi:hypothetical protein